VVVGQFDQLGTGSSGGHRASAAFAEGVGSGAIMW